MGCGVSTQIAVTSNDQQVIKNYPEANRRGSACTQITQSTDNSGPADDASILSGGVPGSKKRNPASAKLTLVQDMSMNWEKPIESNKTTSTASTVSLGSRKESNLAFNLKAKKYKSPYVREDDPSIFDSATESEVAVQAGSWYPKPRPSLTIEIYR